MSRTLIDQSLINKLATGDASSTSSTATSSLSFVDTALFASITPKFATNRVRVIVSTVCNISTTERATYGISRNGSDLQAAGMSELAGNANFSTSISFSYIDSPASTSTLTYRLRIKSTIGTTVTDNPQNNFASIRLEEII